MVKHGGKQVYGGMSTTAIVLIVLSIIVLFGIGIYLYTTTSGGMNTLLATTVNLNTKPPQDPVLVAKLTNPQSTRYAYGIWVYVNTWDTNMNKVIFSRHKDILLYLDKTTGVFNCVIGSKKSFYSESVIEGKLNKAMNPDMLEPSYKATPNFITVMNNFPIQTWVNIVVNIDNTNSDIYINGKLVKSIQINQVEPDKTNDLYYGNGYDAAVAGFNRWSLPVTPNQVWNQYLNGNGSGSLANMLGGSYNASVTIKKNNAITSQFNLF